jgi:hypothetical protein
MSGCLGVSKGSHGYFSCTWVNFMHLHMPWALYCMCLVLLCVWVHPSSLAIA